MSSKQNLSRRSMVAGLAAAAPALAVGQASAQGSGTDPVFAAIDAHRRAAADHAASVDTVVTLEESLPETSRQWIVSDDALVPPADNSDDPRWIAAQNAILKTGEALDKAAWALIDDAPPKTVAGAAALLGYAHEFAVSGQHWPTSAGEGAAETESWNSELHRVVAESLAGNASA